MNDDNKRDLFGPSSAVSMDPNPVREGKSFSIAMADVSSLHSANAQAIFSNCTTRIVLEGDAVTDSLTQG